MKSIEDEFARLRERYVAAVARRDETALLQLYDPKARVFDAWGVWQYQGTEPWRSAITGWFTSEPDTRFEVAFLDCQVVGTVDLACQSALVHYACIDPDGKPRHALHNRMSWVARASGHSLRIVHEHTSAPIGFEDQKALLQWPG